jgi:RNA polymerase sigma-70 factor, ECF subfamily
VGHPAVSEQNWRNSVSLYKNDRARYAERAGARTMGSIREKLFLDQVFIYSDELYNFAARSAGVENASDIVQDTFKKAYKAFNRTNNVFDHRKWIFRILKNTIIDHYRKNKRITNLDLEDLPDKCNIESNFLNPLYSIDPLLQLMNMEFAQQSQKIIDKLPILLKIAFLLYIEGFRYEEIAIIMDCPEGTIKSRIHRAREIVRKDLFNFYSDG